jgi:hypothetical protein
VLERNQLPWPSIIWPSVRLPEGAVWRSR